MPRTLINLEPEDKHWIDREARRRHVPMTELVRQAVHLFRIRTESLAQHDLQAILAQTTGIRRGHDGLEHQKRLREEWDARF
jgi:hypothetical protein